MKDFLILTTTKNMEILQMKYFTNLNISIIKTLDEMNCDSECFLIDNKMKNFIKKDINHKNICFLDFEEIIVLLEFYNNNYSNILHNLVKDSNTLLIGDLMLGLNHLILNIIQPVIIDLDMIENNFINNSSIVQVISQIQKQLNKFTRISRAISILKHNDVLIDSSQFNDELRDVLYIVRDSFNKEKLNIECSNNKIKFRIIKRSVIKLILEYLLLIKLLKSKNADNKQNEDIIIDMENNNNNLMIDISMKNEKCLENMTSVRYNTNNTYYNFYKLIIENDLKNINANAKECIENNIFKISIDIPIKSIMGVK